MHPLALCGFGPGQYLLFGPEVGPLQYYSHLPVIAIALGLGGFIFFNNRKALANKVLFGTIITYTLWVFLDSVIWASNESNVIMFAWSLQILVEPLVYFGSLYLLYVLATKRDISFILKLLWSALYLPIVLTAFTSLNLNGFDVVNCLATEGWIGHYYSYGLEIFLMIWVLVYSIYAVTKTPTRMEKARMASLSVGIIFFLFTFAWGNIIGSYSGDWQLAQYGLFGMPVFTAFLVYSIVKYRTFNIRLIGSVALVVGLGALTFSLLFVNQASVFRQVSFVTFILSLVFGYMLIRSVKREAKQRERIENLAKELSESNLGLEQANSQQIVLIHFITHQLKGFVAKSRNIFSMIEEGDFGPIPEQMKPMIAEGFASSTKGAKTIQEILNAANIKNGIVTYAKEPFDFKALVDSVIAGLKHNADEKNLVLEVHEPEEYLMLTGDRMQMENAIRNLIDNSIKYTPQGSIKVTLTEDATQICLVVEDTGVGITPADMQNLFTEGGHGAESQKVNVDSTGFGLYIVKKIIEAHGGTVRAGSEGAGKGSRFVVELPVSQS